MNMMGMAGRIQQLRRAKGISQEELAGEIGVSRQAVSKWESGQSAPDIDKLLLLSTYFETTADYLLRGIEPSAGAGRQHSAVLPAIVGTILNAVGLVCAITIWIERQVAYATGIGLVMALLGVGCFLAGQLLDFREQGRARRLFFLFNVWTLLPIPSALGFNLLCGLRSGSFGELSPLPLAGYSLPLFFLYWVCYFGVCVAVDVLVLKKAGTAKG